MKRQVAVFVIALTSCLSLPAAADSPSLTGAIYFGSPATTGNRAIVPTALALSGAQAYVRPDAGGDWIGPVSTDIYGRFTFASLPDGVYQLRLFRGQFRLWDQIVKVPAVLKQIVVRDIAVAYYVKPQDRGKIAEFLGNLSYPYELRTPEYDTATNIIWFGDNVRREDIKTIANALIGAGVSLRAIRRFASGSGPKASLIEIGASKQHVKDPVLTVDDIRNASDWPRAR